MPLNDREQEILEEIERQLYSQDPDLATAVRDIEKTEQPAIKLPVIGLVVGLVVTIASFTSSVWIAMVGFIVMVVSATVLVRALGSRFEVEREGEDPGSRWIPFGRGD
ncbi:MAG: DUF3040 domain-containing protein [Acidimicrobiia bacterium]|nr:DUF3040 domain-containing protein [Acidimicrobiia bacterium]